MWWIVWAGELLVVAAARVVAVDDLRPDATDFGRVAIKSALAELPMRNPSSDSVVSARHGG